MKSEYLPALYASFADAVEAQVELRGSKTAIRFLHTNEQESSATFAGLAAAAKSIASGLQHYCKPGDRAFLIFDPGVELIQTFLGCLYSGAIAVLSYPPTNARLGAKLEKLIRNCSPSVIVTSARQAQAMASYAVCKDVKWVIYEDLIKAPALDGSPALITLDNIAFLQYTSGSTGDPKGVMVSHRNILHNTAINSNFSGCYKDNTVLVNWLPPYHDMGLIGSILTPIACGATSVLMSPMTFMRHPLKWLKGISEYKATIGMGPNFAYDYCVDRIRERDKASLDLSTWECAITGAEPVSADTLDRFYQAFKANGFKRNAFVSSYGLAEVTLCASSSRLGAGPTIEVVSRQGIKNRSVQAAGDDADRQVLVSAGRPHLDVVVVDPATSTPSAENCIGEVWISGDSVARGYWNLPEKTEETFGATLPGDEGRRYLRTGDLGFMRTGELYITGRSKDLIILNGQNIYPQDIERAAQSSHPLLKSASSAAFEIRQKGTTLCLVAEVQERIPADYAEVARSVRSEVLQLLGFNVRRIVLIRSRSLPRTTSGKVQRSEAQALLEQLKLPILFDDDQAHDAAPGPTSPAAAAPRADCSGSCVAIKQGIKASLRRVMHLGDEVEIDEDTSFADMGMDSLMAVELLCELEGLAKGKAIDQESIQRYPTTAKLADFLLTDPGTAHAHPAACASHLSRWTDFRQLPSYIELQKQRQQLRKFDMDRYFFQKSDGLSANSIHLDGELHVNFSSYNYLGLSGHEAVSASVTAAVSRYGTSVSASRLVSGNKVLHVELEEEIAGFIGTESSVIFPAGHATNVSTITHLMGANDVIFYDSLCHNSLIQGALFSGTTRFAFNHDDPVHLDQLLSQHRANFERALILTEGVFSMDGDIPDIPALVGLKKKHGCWLMVDEAHSIGTVGVTGRGVCEHFDLPPHEIDILMGTLSKSFASGGGYVAGCQSLIENLKYKAAGFVFSAGTTPANAAAALQAIRVLRDEPERVARLQQNSATLLKGFKRYGANTGRSAGTPVVPIIMATENDTMRLSKSLRKARVLALPILYPAVPKDQSRVRFFVSSAHTPDDLQRTIDAVELGLLPAHG